MFIERAFFLVFYSLYLSDSSQKAALTLFSLLFALLFPLISPHHFLATAVHKSHLYFFLQFGSILFYPSVFPRIEQKPVLLLPALLYFFPQPLPCFYDLCDHVPYLYEIIMVLHPLVIMAEPVFQIIPLFFLRIKPFVFYLPSPSSPFHGFFYISPRNTQIRYTQKFLLLFLTLVFSNVDTLSAIIYPCNIVINSYRLFLPVLCPLF